VTTPERATERDRILIVQDVALSARQQKQFLEAEAGRRELLLEVRHVDLRVPADVLLREQLLPGAPVDWLIVDLLVSEVDDRAPVESSTGMTLLRRLAAEGLFHGYKPRSPTLTRGARCIAVYSAMLQGQGAPRQRTEDALDALGVRRSARYAPGDMTRVAVDICAELAAARRGGARSG